MTDDHRIKRLVDKFDRLPPEAQTIVERVIDVILREGNTGASEEEIEATLKRLFPNLFNIH